MSENGNGGTSGFAYFLAGLSFGALITLLFAPKTGQETRDLIGAKANEGKEYVTAKSKEVREQAEQMVGKAKDLVAQQKEQLSAALEAGKQAYQEERAKAR
ncbi:MAG TPA: YtxH domain-containing protein [Terriglobia bacterium]|nr:YtxH domain-containing protein [Terriglobia bacterium]